MRATIFIVVILFPGCYEYYKTTAPTYNALYAIHPKTQSSSWLKLFLKYRELKFPQSPQLKSWSTGWVYQPGTSNETLHAGAKPVKGPVVHLPHVVQQPNCSMWYRQEIDVPDDGFLQIVADDGAQLFVNGIQVHRITGNYFQVDKGKKDIVIRVLNNAMSGGLKHVSFLTSTQYKNFCKQVENYLAVRHALEKVLTRNPPIEAEIVQALGKYSAQKANPNDLFKENHGPHPLITGPWVQRIHHNEFIVKVWIERTARVQFLYGFMPNRFDRQLEQMCQVCEFKISVLPKHSYVYYRVQADDTYSASYSFSAKEEEKFSFHVWADSQSGWESFSRNMLNILPFNDAFGIGVGDLVSNGSNESEWRTFFSILSLSAANKYYYLIAGNHDYDGYYDSLIPRLYHRLVSSPSYQSWSYNNCAFIALDPNENFPVGVPENTPQHSWFRKQLESAKWKSATWRFVLIHQPPYSQGWAGYEGDVAVRELLEPVLESAQIDFVISGHTHDYERLSRFYGKQKVTFLVVGGGGGTLESPASSPAPKMDTVIKQHHFGRFCVSGPTIRFEARNINNEVIDSFVLSK